MAFTVCKSPRLTRKILVLWRLGSTFIAIAGGLSNLFGLSEGGEVEVSLTLLSVLGDGLTSGISSRYDFGFTSILQAGSLMLQHVLTGVSFLSVSILNAV